jgi:tetratricopeptide (TPR) repeat protein
VFKEGLSLHPEERTIYLQAAQFYIQSGRVPDAEAVLRQAQAKNPGTPEPSLVLVDLLSSAGRQPDARNTLSELKKQFPENIDVAVKTALDLMQDQPEKAQAEIDLILKTAPKNPIGYLLLGNSQFAAGKYDDAEKTLNNTLVLDSPLPQVHFILGNIAVMKGLVDSGLFHYQKSLAVNSSYLPARVALAEVFLAKGRLADSKEELRKALEVRSDFVPARLFKAKIDSLDKNNKDAEAELTALTKEQPQNATVFRQMALYYDSRGRTSDAETNFMRALELDPDSQESLRDLTWFYIRQKQTDKAIQKISAVPESKKQAFHYELMGRVYSEAGKLQESEGAYKKALEKDPNRTSSNFLLFTDYMKSGRMDEGIARLNELIKKNPNDATAYGLRGQIYESQGKRTEAKQSYSQALKINPGLDVAANNLAYILAEEGTDLNTALGYAQTARQKQPESASIADTLGWVYFKLGNYVLAREQAKFAISKDPENASFNYHLGMIYKESKQLAEAQTALKKASTSKDPKEKSLAEAALKEIGR